MPAGRERRNPGTTVTTRATRGAAPRSKTKPGTRAAAREAARDATLDERVQAALAALAKAATRRDLDNLARFGITATNALGVSMANIQKIAKPIGRSHELALALWETGCYEARLLTAFVDDPGKVTPAQMDRWCRDFDNWGICDTLCFKLFDQTPHAWALLGKWSTRRNEHEKRAAFALLASLAGHDKRATNEQFLEGLTLIERAATDDRNFVKKGVSWALRRIGGRNSQLHAAATRLAARLAASPDAAARWIGNDALREFGSDAHKKRLSAGSRK